MSTLGGLAKLAEAVAADDRIHIWNTSAAEGYRDQYMDPAQLRGIVLGAANTWTANQTFSGDSALGGHLYMENNKAISGKDSGGTLRNLFHINASDHLIVGYGLQSGKYIGFAPGGSLKMAVLADGTVGIGTSSPAGALHVAGRMLSASGMGWRHTKSLANNTATNIAVVTYPAANMLGTFLVTLSMSASGKRAAVTYAVTTVYDKVNLGQLVAPPAYIGVSSLSMTAAMNTTNRTLTLTVTQVSGAAETVEVAVQPVAVYGDEAVTFTGS